jgi:cytochrome b involved in lipid metabolism
MSQAFSKDQVASHSKSDSLWVVIDEDVYDLTKFQDEHPGMLGEPARSGHVVNYFVLGCER